MKTIVLACGGAGIKTAIRLNEMLASNPAQRQILERDVYYIAADTDIHALQMFDSFIKRQSELNGRQPYYRCLSLADNYDKLSELTRKREMHKVKDKNGNPIQGKERLQEHWWYRNDIPFEAPNVMPLKMGSSRCAPAAYLLTWDMLKQVEKIVQDILHEMHIRRDDAGDYGLMDNIQLIAIAGLAGGTGRGCWNLLALKIKEYFHSHECALKSLGVFFDVTAYPNVIAEIPGCAYQLKVNTLTGFSELSCWTRPGQNENVGFMYRLPDLEKPENACRDVLMTGIDPNGCYNVNALVPVNRALIICGDNSAAVRLYKDHHYHEMAASGICAMLSSSELASRLSNRIAPFQSFGTVTFEVENAKIGAYLEKLACQLIAQFLMGEAGMRFPARWRISSGRFPCG